MSNSAIPTLLALTGIGLEIGLPALVIWGWVRWFKRQQPRTLLSTLSLIGFVLATASTVLAFTSVLYSIAVGGFPYYDPLLLKIYRWGSFLSLSGIVFAISGIWRPGPLRWHAPACAIGMLLFWFAMAIGE